MKQINPVLDSTPSNENIGRFIDAEIRNNICFTELQYYEKHNTFMGIHPFTKEYQDECRLAWLLKEDTKQFMSELVNADKNITRYESQIKNKKYKDEEQLRDWLNHIEKFKATLKIMQTLISAQN